MDFRHTIDPNADEPIMLIDSHIGMDSEDGPGVMADQFCRELLFLDTLGKSRINVWINSPGGSVVDGMQIFNTILKARTKVDTHNVGMAASIAAPIFLAGRNRYMMDNAVFMVHPVSGPDEQVRQLFETCVNTMISSRSYLSSEKVAGMMAATTWMNATECRDMGLCEMEDSASFNKKRAVNPDLTNVNNAFKVYRDIVNSAINDLKPKPMNKVTNRLKLVDGSNEDAQVAAIDAIENRARSAEDSLNKVKTEIVNLEKEVAEVKNKLADAEAKIKAANDAKEKAEKDKAEAEATAEITNAVKVGKIKNDAEVIKTWTANYLANPAGTKSMLDSMGASKNSVKIPTVGGATDENALTNVAAVEMAAIRAKLQKQ